MHWKLTLSILSPFSLSAFLRCFYKQLRTGLQVKHRYHFAYGLFLSEQYGSPFMHSFANCLLLRHLKHFLLNCSLQALAKSSKMSHFFPLGALNLHSTKRLTMSTFSIFSWTTVMPPFQPHWLWLLNYLSHLTSDPPVIRYLPLVLTLNGSDACIDLYRSIPVLVVFLYG